MNENEDMIPPRYGREHFYYRLEGEDSQKHPEESRPNMASRIDQAMEEVGRAREGEERGERGNRLREDRSRAKSGTESPQLEWLRHIGKTGGSEARELERFRVRGGECPPDDSVTEVK